MLSLQRDCYRTMLDHADSGGKAEVCGILGGAFGRDHSVVESAHRATNVAENPGTRYAIDPEEQLELMERIRDTGTDVVGFYHSHPSGPPVPSGTDVRLATWPNRSYVIVTPDGDPTVQSWRWNPTDEQFDSERLVTL